MTEYLSLFPTSLHIVLIVYVIISHNNEKFLRERIEPNSESPLYWQMNPASSYQIILHIYEYFNIVILFASAILIGIYFKWYFAIFFLIEALLVSGIIIGILKAILLKISDAGFFEFKLLIYKTRILTLFVDGYLFYNLYKIIFVNK